MLKLKLHIVQQLPKHLQKNSSKPKLSTFTKTFPRIDCNTLHWHLNGGLTKQGLALKQGLSPETQSESLISFILEMAEKGFPLSYKKIKEYALSILCTKDPTCATYWGELGMAICCTLQRLDWGKNLWYNGEEVCKCSESSYSQQLL